MQVIIVGNGITGITAALTLRRLSNCRITVISEESKFFYARTALMYYFMGHINRKQLHPYEDWFWEEQQIELLQAQVKLVLPQEKQVLLENGQKLPYHKLLLATGSRPNSFGCPGLNLQGVQGLYTLQDAEAMAKHTAGIEKAVIVGGGLIGVELAEMLQSRNVQVTFLEKEANYWGKMLPEQEAYMIERHLRGHHLDLRLSTELCAVNGDAAGKIISVLTSAGEVIPCSFVGLAVGVSPNVRLAQACGIEVKRGVLVNEYLETSVPDVYAAGDCAEFREPQPGQPALEQLWYTGRLQGETAGHTLAGKRTAYTRGIGFNSAKFFGIEHQSYGSVKPGQEEETLYWEHPNGRQSIRINYKGKDGTVTGFCLMGLRFRHETCERWIRSGQILENVLQHLDEAEFNPEFSLSCKKQLLEQYRQLHPGFMPEQKQAKKGRPWKFIFKTGKDDEA